MVRAKLSHTVKMLFVAMNKKVTDLGPEIIAYLIFNSCRSFKARHSEILTPVHMVLMCPHHWTGRAKTRRRETQRHGFATVIVFHVTTGDQFATS